MDLVLEGSFQIFFSVSFCDLNLNPGKNYKIFLISSSSTSENNAQYNPYIYRELQYTSS